MIEKQIADAEEFAKVLVASVSEQDDFEPMSSIKVGKAPINKEAEEFAEQVMDKHSVDPKIVHDFYVEGQRYAAPLNKPSTYTYSYRKAMQKLYGKSETTIFEFGNMLKEKFLDRARVYTEFAKKIEQLEDEQLKTINDVTINYYLANLAGILIQMKDLPSEEYYGLMHINMLRQLYNID